MANSKGIVLKPSRPLKDFMNVRTELAGKEFMLKFYNHRCSNANDNEWLRKQGFMVPGADPRDYIRRDIVLSIYVLNSIPKKKDRILCIEQAWSSVRKGGYLVLSTRTDKQIEQLAKKNNWKSHNDGYLTKTGTFQKGFALEELTNFAVKNLPKIKTIIQREDKQSIYSAIYIMKRKR